MHIFDQTTVLFLPSHKIKWNYWKILLFY